jgi:large subunit ribosomal protein L9
MEIILKEDIPNLGYKDDIVKVKDGYARNYLIPKGYAVQATPSAKKAHLEIMKQRAQKEEKIRKDAEATAEKIQNIKLKVLAKTSSTGKIFGSVNNIQIADALEKEGIKVDRKNITINAEHIKEVGTYTATVKIYKDIKAEVTFDVVAEEE